MMRSFLAALQLADSSLPIGRFVHSFGLEALLRADPTAGEAEIIEIVESAISGSVGPLDAVVLAHAHAAAGEGDLARLVALDVFLDGHKLSPPSRAASAGCGRGLASIALALTDSEPVVELCELVTRAGTPGHLAVVEGAVAAALGIGRQEAVLLELRGAAAALLSAAVRLGRMSASRAQQAQHALEPLLLRVAADALAASLDEVHSCLLELDLHAVRHSRADSRVFAT